MPNGKRRRKWLRCAGRFPVKLLMLDNKNRKIWAGVGSTTNIGGGGALLEVEGLEGKLIEDLIKAKYTLQLAFELPRPFFRARVRAKVIWVEEFQMQKGISRRCGVTFKDLTKKTEDKIVNFVEDCVATETAEYALKVSFQKRRKKQKKN